MSAAQAPSSPAVSVIVVAYRSGEALAACLAALKAQTCADFETLLLDNASGDGLAAAAAAADPSLRLLQMDANLGFAAGNNRAAREARGRWLALLNPDAYAAPDWLERLLAAAAAHPRARCFTSRQLMAADPARLDGLGDAMALFGFPFRGGYGRPDVGAAAEGEVFSPCGAAMMIDSQLFAELGGFDEDFFCYCEDVDLGYRLRLRGEPVRLAAGAVVRHEGSVSTGGRRSDFSRYHGIRNRLWAYLKNTPPLLLALTLPVHLGLTLAAWGSAQVRGEGAAATRALADAWAGLPRVLEKRRAVQAARTATSADIARVMSWNPLAVARRRAAVTRP
jgi:GT2 family glycosyltransferase